MPTIDKAIKTLKETPIQVVSGDDLEYGEARQLSIEALKEVRRHRRPTNLAIIGLLPGETEE